MDFTPTVEETEIQMAVRAFVTKELLPLEPELLQRELDGGVPDLTRAEMRALQAKARISGLWGVDTPEEHGGADLGDVAVALVNLELGRTFIDFRFGGSASPNLYLMNQEQLDRYLQPVLEGEITCCFALTEPQSGSDARNIATTAVRDGDDWVVNGQKTWISRADEDDACFLFARTPHEGDPDGITLFFVEREMGWKSAPIPVLGTMTCGSITFDDVRVPDANRIGPVNEGFTLAMKQLHLMRAFGPPAKNIGACERLLSMAIDYAKERVTFGKPLSARQNIQWMIADADAQVRAGKLLVFHAAAKAGRKEDFRHEANVAKLFVAQMANRLVDDVLQVHGAMGYSMEVPIQRWYRNLRIHRIFEGSDEMNRMAMQRNLFNGTVAPGQLW